MSIYVFTGPTLPAAEARARLPEAVVLPPVAQGDVLRAARRRPRMIGIIDGYFESVPSVWHKEILWAMSEGVHVFGASSMGALRAAELEPFGMVGVGAVFERYRDGAYEDDDEVAVVHGPAADGYRALSVAMVNVRATVVAAARAGALDAGGAAAVIRAAKDLYYGERSWPAILAAARGELDRFRRWLPDGQVDQKRLDALAMLDVMRARAGAPPKRVSFAFQHTDAWDTALREAGELGEGSDGAVSADALADELRLDGEELYGRFELGAFTRFLALSEARFQRVVPDQATVGAVRDALLEAHGAAPDERQAWMAAMDLSPAQLDRLASEEACRAWVHASARSDFEHQLADELRVAGEYPRLARRAREKERLLAAHGLENPGLDDAGFADDQALLRWYFVERLGLPEVPDVAAHAARVGAESEDALRRMMLRERCVERLRATARLAA